MLKGSLVMGNLEVIVLTGGPCSGKSTALVKISEIFSNFGYSVLTVPEAATEFFSNGVEIEGDGISNIDFQKQILLAQIEREERYKSMAWCFKNPKRLVVADRGRMDGKAYMFPGLFEEMIKRMGFSVTELRDKPYGAIIHLVTAAIGARDYYVNTLARKETPEEAALLDQKTCNSWIGCPHLSIIDNSTDFEGKMKRLVKTVCRVLGIPIPIEEERGFIVYIPDFDKIPVYVNSVEIEQPYLLSRLYDFQRRVRKRGQGGHYVFYETLKKDIGVGRRQEIEKQITEREYLKLVRDEKDPRRDIIEKTRHCFAWNSQYFELDVFKPIFEERIKHQLIDDGTVFDINRKVARLEIELTEDHRLVEIPPFIEVIKEVTGYDRYSNRSLAKHI